MVDERARLREMLAELEECLDGLRDKQGVPKDRFETDVDYMSSVTTIATPP